MIDWSLVLFSAVWIGGAALGLAVLSYAFTGLSSVLVVGRIGLGGAALAGLCAMLPWIVLGWQERRG